MAELLEEELSAHSSSVEETSPRWDPHDDEIVLLQRLRRGSTFEHWAALAAVEGGVRRVVASILHPYLAEDAVLLQQLQSLARWPHPSVVATYEVSRVTVQGGHETVVLLRESVEGEDLHALSRRLGPWPPSAVVEVGRQLATLLATVPEPWMVVGIEPAKLKVDTGAALRLRLLLQAGTDETRVPRGARRLVAVGPLYGEERA